MKIFNRILAVSLALLSLGCVTGCDSSFEEITDINLGRCLQPLNLSAKVTNGQTVTFSWDVTKDAEMFLLEVFEDKGMTQSIHSQNYKPGEVPVSLYLDVDKEYYFRVQAVRQNAESSKWAVYEKSIKTFAVKSNLYMEVAARAAQSISLVWTADPEVDRIEYGKPGDEEYKVYTLTESDKAAGTATVTGLVPSTEYDMVLYFSSANRGQVDVWTLPDPDGLTRVSTSADLERVITDGGKVLLTMDGSPYTIGADLAKGFDVSKSFELHGEGAADGSMPVVNGSVNITDSFDGGSILFEGVCFDGKDNTCGFLIQHKEGSTADGVKVGSIVFRNCVIKGYSKGLMYEWNKTLDIGEFTFDSCDIHAVNGDGTGGGDGFDLRNATKIDNLNFINNTIYNSFRTFLRIDANPVLGAVKFENNTVMNLCFVDNTNNGGIFGFQTVPGSLSLKNNLFLNMVEKSTMVSANAKYKGIADMNSSVSNNWFYNCVETFFNDHATLSSMSGSTLAEDPCFNAKGGLFNILAASEISGKQVGAPKWWNEYVEAPEDLTLTVVEAPHTWDFTNAAYFSSDFNKSKVRDQLLFSVTENKITAADGIIGFTKSATTTRKGIPTDGYIAFLVDQPGSVVIKAVDPNNKGGHFVVGVGPQTGSSIAVKGGAAAMADMSTPTKILVKDITEPTLVYIYPSGEISLEKLAWSADVAPVNTALPAPKASSNPATITAGEPEDVTISWEPVEYAESYSVVFSGKTYVVDEGTSYTISGSVIGMLDAGSYKAEVYANPGRNDIYNTTSEAGVATFAIQPAGGEEPSSSFVVASVEELLTAISAGKQDITLKYSETPYEIGTLVLNTPLHLYGQEENGKKTPVVASITLSGNIIGDGKGSVVLSNLDITNAGASVLIEDKTADLAPQVDTVAVINCNIHGTKALYDNSGKANSCV
ncbi:MAG: DUF4957 domain-containing protein, partial [Bacteroidales bacterium]|nr:DUF4957 domain-containing protein [Bacteroidales bacterium]